MTAWIFLALAWLAGFSAPSQEAAPVERIDCPTCAGTGIAEQPCLRCDGDKSTPCQVCCPLEEELEWIGHFEALAKLLPEDAKLAERAKLLKDLSKARQSAEEVFDTESNAPKPRGTRRCPICMLNAAWSVAAKCKLCGGTTRVHCPACDAKGRRPCAECQRKGTRRRTCETCNGTKQVARPPARPSDDACPWCNRLGWRECAQCEGGAPRETACIVCNGSKTAPCWDCVGGRRARCPACMGSGRPFANPSGPTPAECKNCKGTGQVPCESCKATGKTSCTTCKGKGTNLRSCESCYGERKALCNGCTGLSARAWEVSAELLGSSGARDEALAYWKIVESRTERRFAALLESALGSDARKDVEKARIAELARVRKRIAASKS